MRAALKQHHQLVRSLDRQLPEQDLIDEGKNCGVGADAKRQRENRDGCEQGAAAEPADGKTQV